MSSIEPLRNTCKPNWMNIRLWNPAVAVSALVISSVAFTPDGSYFGIVILKKLFSGDRDLPVFSEMN